MNEDTKKKLDRIQELINQKGAIEKELEKLLSPEKVVAFPPNFSLNNEILEIIRNAGNKGTASKSILRALQQKYPDYGINRKQVASTLAYLKNTKKTLEILDRGIYRLKEPQKGGDGGVENK